MFCLPARQDRLAYRFCRQERCPGGWIAGWAYSHEIETDHVQFVQEADGNYNLSWGV